MHKSIRAWSNKAREVELIRMQTLGLRKTNNDVEALARARDIGMEHAERTSREGRGLLSSDKQEASKRGIDPGRKFNRIAREVRQIVVLHQEFLGNRTVVGLRWGEPAAVGCRRTAATRRAAGSAAIWRTGHGLT